jgi:GDPmannose 4,6-dehydratase
VTRKVTDAVAKIKLGLASSVTLGNLDSRRDWGFAGDFVEAMWLMLQQSAARDYVIATGEQHTIGDLCRVAFEHVGITDWQPLVKSDPRFKRPAELYSLCGDSTSARNLLGWQPRVSFEDMVRSMVDADLERLQTGQ